MTKRQKTVLNLSAMDYGGAGKFAVDFHRLLQTTGHRSYLVVKEAKTSQPGIFQYRTSPFDNPVGKLFRRIRKRDWPDENFHYDYCFYNKYERYSVVSAQQILSLLPAKPDVIFVHWVTDFINARVLGELKQLTKAKIYWLIVDNSPLTGGCHYPWQCRGFEQDCTNCPAIKQEKHQWMAAENMAFKKKYLPADITMIAFSESDYERVQRSVLFRDRPVAKWFGLVDETLFKPGNKAVARAHFGLPAAKKTILFGAHSLIDKRKGMALLLEAIALLEDQDIHLLIAGRSVDLPRTLSVTYTGYLSELDLIKAYQAADLFVCPTLEDSGPIMINQALMCGTPVVAFHTGVAQDLVITGETGYKVIDVSAAGLAQGIDAMFGLDACEAQAMSERCHTLALAKYSRTVVANQLDSLLLGHE